MDDDEDQSDYLEEEEESIYPPTGPRARAYSILRQVFCYCSVASLAYQFVIFENMGLTGVILLKKPNYYITEVFNIGSCIGYVCCGIYLHTLGSKSAVVVGNLLNLSIAVMACINYEKMDNFVYTTYFVGFVIAFSEMAAYVYMAEVADNTLRPFFVGFPFLLYGVIKLKYPSTEVMRPIKALPLVGVALGVGSTALSVFVPQTPFWMALKGDPEKARSIFTWLRAGDSDDDECELMIEKAELSDGREFARQLRSPTFAMCLAFCSILDFCLLGKCDMHRILFHDLYLPKVDLPKYPLKKFARDFYVAVKIHKNQDVILGCLLYEVLCVFVPRKIMYLTSIVFDMLLAAPVALHVSLDKLVKIVPLCQMAGNMGRIPTIFLIPIEIFPAILRPLGVAISYSMYKIIDILHERMYTPANEGYYTAPLPFKWGYMNYLISIILIPFLLVYMPETMGISLYELEEIKTPFADASTQPESAEETVEEE